MLFLSINIKVRKIINLRRASFHWSSLQKRTSEYFDWELLSCCLWAVGVHVVTELVLWGSWVSVCEELHVDAGVQAAVASVYLFSDVLGYFGGPECQVIVRSCGWAFRFSSCCCIFLFGAVEVILQKLRDQPHMSFSCCKPGRHGI